MYQKILVPLDGSKRAEAILSHVESIAKSNHAKVFFLKVEEEPIMLERDEVIDIAKYNEVFTKQVARSQTYLDQLHARFYEIGINAVTQLAYGSVVKAILNVAAETGADLIAMATHGLSGLARVSYGNVAAGVLQAADIPILLIRSGDDSLTGVALTRNGTTGENRIEGDYLIKAQGEDVVAGIRQTNDLSQLKSELPDIYAQFEQIVRRLEKHYREMQDVEFTVEKGKLLMLQTRSGKRTAQAAVRIAVEMAEEKLISKQEAVLRIMPEQVDFFLHPQFEHEAEAGAKAKGAMLATGLNVSPGAAVGIVAFDADLAEMWAKEQSKDVIMVRPETKPDDVHGMLAAQGILTSRGGRTSHAALVARQFGKPAVVGVSELKIDMNKRLTCSSSMCCPCRPA